MSLGVNEWQQYFDKVFPPRALYDTRLVDVRHPLFDAKNTLVEIVLALRKCKPQKAVRPDGITNAFCKAASSKWILYSKSFYNTICSSENKPDSWVNSLKLIKKKMENPVPSLQTLGKYSLLLITFFYGISYINQAKVAHSKGL